MSKADDGWNIIKLREKGQLIPVDVVSDDFYVDDDDILSNTSSDDYADLSNPFNSNEKKAGNGINVSDSFETLTGSRNLALPKTSEITEDDASSNRLTKKRLANKILSNFNRYGKPELKLWHVAMISSLVTVLVLVGTQRYFEIFNGIFKKDGVSVANNSNTQDLIYSDINFLNHDEPLLSTWKPSGKYYVDFDNHIAYPLPREELLGWQKFKTDSAILWYTSKSKINSVLASDSFAAVQQEYYKIVSLIKLDAIRIRDRITLAKFTVINKFHSTLPLFKANLKRQWGNFQHSCEILGENIGVSCRTWRLKLQRGIQSSDIKVKVQKFYFATKNFVGQGVKSAKCRSLEIKTFINKRWSPKFKYFGKLGQNLKKWPSFSDKKAKILFSRFQAKFTKRKPSFVASRLSRNLKGCEQMIRRRLKNLQFSKPNIFKR